jgi:thiol-disulfide isomerase/thioredoxin
MERSARRRIGWGVLIVLVLAVLAVFGLRSEGGPAGGRAAPELPRQALVGGPLSLSSLVAGGHGRPSLVLFWASWCGPCKNEAPEIERYARTSQGSGRIVGVNWSDGLSGARGFIAKYGWTFPNLRDGDGSVGNSYKLTGLPTTFVVSGKGRITATLRGPQTEAALHAAMSAAEAG